MSEANGTSEMSTAPPSSSRWRRKRFYDEMEDSKQKWSFDREVIEVIGMGRHTKFVWGWPPIGHGWDQELNVLIRNWVSRF